VARITFVVVLAVALVLLVAGLLVDSAVLAVIGLFGGVVVAAVWALAAGGDWLRDASSGRFDRGGR